MAEIKITEQNFEKEVLQSDQPVLLDFWAPWCGPCSMLSPVLKELAVKYEGKVKIGKVNVDEESGLAAAFQVMSIPYLVVFKEGKIVSTSVGFRSKADVEAMIR